MNYAFDTRCIHGEGHKTPDGNNAICYPIYQTASFSHLTPGHNLNGFDYTRESNPTRSYLEETVSSLEHAVDTVAFSSGMAAKLKIAVTMARDAKVYMLDEPFNGLDGENVGRCAEEILRATEGKTLLVITHYESEAELLCCQKKKPYSQ